MTNPANYPTARHLAAARKMAAAIDQTLTLQDWIDIETQTLDREEAILVEAECRQVWAEVGSTLTATR